MSIRAETSFSLKDNLFNRDTVAELGGRLAAAQKRFPRKRFETAVLARFPELELKARIDWMVTLLEAALPEDFDAALDVLHRALPEPLDPTRSDDDFGRYIWVVPGEYVARQGVRADRLEASLGFLRESTKRFSAESALRPFLREFPRETLKFVNACTGDGHYHVRRLASEGIRPLLPWAERVTLPVAEIIRVLDKLHADPTRFVTRSVANNLNDLSKTEPAPVLAALERWQRTGRQAPDELDWMVRHALRTLTRQHDPAAMALLGYPDKPAVDLETLDVPGAVAVGETLTCRIQLRSKRAQKLQVTLNVHFLKADGRQRPKVFTICKATFGAGEQLTLAKKIAFRPMTTRVLYPGGHRLELVVNGRTLGERAFELTV